jgi:hypothetical protein
MPAEVVTGHAHVVSFCECHQIVRCRKIVSSAFRVGSPPFISFSATRMLHCSARMGVREAFFSWEWETAEPASRFFLEAAERRVLDSTRGKGNRKAIEEGAATSRI